MNEDTPPCPYAGEHPAFRERLAGLERRMEVVEETQGEKWDSLWKAVGEVRESVANLNGRIAGYLLAAGLLGSVVAIIAQVAIGHVQSDRLVSRQDVQLQPGK